MTGLDVFATVKLSNTTVESALRTALDGHGLTFQAMGPKNAVIYPDTPANRDEYAASVRVVPIAKADIARLIVELNRNTLTTRSTRRS